MVDIWNMDNIRVMLEDDTGPRAAQALIDAFSWYDGRHPTAGVCWGAVYEDMMLHKPLPDEVRAKLVTALVLGRI